MCACPGGWRLLSASGEPPRNLERELEQDLSRIGRFRPLALVSLVEADELARLGIAALPRRAALRGWHWLHLPIADMQPPGEAFEHRWAVEGPRVRAALRSGGRVAFHCWAGLGRTGTVAARVLVELGVAPAEAVWRVRTARPGTIQTREQEAHVMACQPVADTAPD
jgi:ADP-ribosyl-[dinitrogen reductase] hydrolase